MKASTDPEIMGATRTAMSGLPADLQAKVQMNPTIAKFLQDVWGALSDESNFVASRDSGGAKSGLDAIRGSVQEYRSGTIEQPMRSPWA